MRDIKFRAWNKDKQLMCYSNEDNDASYWDGVYSSSVDIVNSGFKYNKYIWMQYTGLKDKNGKDICEGDIIKYDNEKYEVIYNNRFSSFELANTGNSVGWYELELLEIIGNIYENKELLNA